MMDFDIEITEKAADHIKSLLKEKEKQFFRISLQGGGCVGLTYLFAFDDKADQRDHVVHKQGVDVLVDKKSAIFLNKVTIDWEESLMKRGFKIINPQQKTSCSCGESFSV